MAGLRDQLLKSGLVDEKQLRKAQKEKIKARLAAPQLAPLEASALESGIEQQQRAKAEKDRRLNLERNESKHQREMVAQIRQLITAHKITEWEGDFPYQFNHEGKIKKLQVSKSLKDHLARGLVGITFLDGCYAMVPRETIEKIRSRLESAVVLLNERNDSSPETSHDDPYADFQVPDDLIW